MTSNLLTHSRMACARTCLRKHELSYILGIRRDRDAKTLRLGDAFHVGLDLKEKGFTTNQAIEAISKRYSELPSWCTTAEAIHEWRLESETVVRLLHAYFWLYADAPLKVVATELSFDIPIVNPSTGKKSRTFRLGGKLDKIVELDDGRLAVMEHKSTSDDLKPDSDYWARLAIDCQISLYVHAARRIGYNVETILYDVVRKPQTSPKMLTQSDTTRFFNAHEYCSEKFDVNCQDGSRWFINGVEAEIDYDGKKPSIRETVDMWGARLTMKIVSDPNYFFARKEIPRLDSDLKEFEAELWQTQQMLRDCERNDRWFKNPNSCLLPFPCEYKALCFNRIDPMGQLPNGFVRVSDVHPELSKELFNVNRTAAETSSAANSEGSTERTAHASADSRAEATNRYSASA